MQMLRAIKHVHWHELAKLALNRIAYFDHCYLMHYRLQGLQPTPPRKIGGAELRRVERCEITSLYDRLPALGFDDKREVLQRIRFYENGFTNCYAIDVDGSLAYLQWIIYPAENQVIRRSYKRLLLPLRENEVAIENAFTFPDFRGRGLMAYATWQLLQMAKNAGYRRGITYARKGSIGSLNTLLHVGFSITKLARDFKILGYSHRTL